MFHGCSFSFPFSLRVMVLFSLFLQVGKHSWDPSMAGGGGGSLALVAEMINS